MNLFFVPASFTFIHQSTKLVQLQNHPPIFLIFLLSLYLRNIVLHSATYRVFHDFRA